MYFKKIDYFKLHIQFAHILCRTQYIIMFLRILKEIIILQKALFSLDSVQNG